MAQQISFSRYYLFSGRLKLCYRDEAGSASERVVWPFALAFFDRVRLLIAWCELRGDFRSFRTDRIVEAEVMEAQVLGTSEDILGASVHPGNRRGAKNGKAQPT